jgi:hypothetical protein
MRSNGLTAATYTPVADLDPSVAETLLDDLKARGVAAAGFDRPEFTVGVKERLYVDSAASARVRELIAGVDPDLLAGNDDLTWAQLVAGFDRPVDADVAPWPVDEDLGAHGTQVVDERDLVGDPEPLPHRPQRRWGFRDDESSDDDDFLSSTTEARDAASEHREERFVPPTPPPLPKLPPVKILAWIGLVGGPLILIIAALFSYQLSGLLLTLAIVGFVGGFITLVATMSDDDDPWDPDHGAVV